MKLKLLRGNLIEKGWNTEGYAQPILRFQSWKLDKKLSKDDKEGFYIGNTKNHEYDLYNATLKKL